MAEGQYNEPYYRHEEVPSCPHKYLGIPTSGGFVLASSTVADSNFQACDSYGCSVDYFKKTSAFGVTLFSSIATSFACLPEQNLPPALEVTIREESDPQIDRFKEVVERAAAVDAAHNEYMKGVSERIRQELEQLDAQAQEKSDTATTKAEEQRASGIKLMDAASRYLADPSTANLNAYNAAKADYAAKSAAARQVISIDAPSAIERVGGKAVEGEIVKGEITRARDKIKALEDAIAGVGSGASFDPDKVAEKTDAKPGLENELAQLQAQIASLKTKLAALTKGLNDLIAEINALGEQLRKKMEEVAKTPLKVGEDPPAEQPPGGDPDTTPIEPGDGGDGGEGEPGTGFCEEHPSDPSCKASTPSKGGELPEFSGSWYEPRYPDGIGGVLQDNSTAMKSTPLFSVMQNIVPTIHGSSHSGCFTIPIWQAGNQEVCIPQIVMQALGIFMLLTAVFAARAIIFGG